MGKLFLPVVIVLSIVGVFMLHIGYIFILLAMIPSFAAYYVDKGSSKSLFKTVAACNFSATIPAMAPMLSASIHNAPYEITKTIADPFVWLFIYISAAAAWGLSFLCKIVARYVVVLVFEYRIALLERAQKKLLEEWGTQLTEENLV